MLTQANNFLKSQGVQVIFVSSDHNEASFWEYYSSMPWKAVPFGRDRRGILEMLNVQGIPKLIILSPDGKIITTEGVELLKSDPSGQRLMSALSPSRPSLTQKQFGQPHQVHQVAQVAQFPSMMQRRF